MGIKAAISALFNKENTEKKKDNRNNHTFTDEDREAALEIRNIRHEIKLLKEKHSLLEAKRDLEEARAELEEDYEDNSEEDANNQLLTLLAPILSSIKNGGAVNPHNITNSVNTAPRVSLDDETIRDFIKKQPANYIRAAKTLPKPLLYRKIQETLPLNPEEFERAYEILQAEF